jgi:hypothetical protein
VLPPDVPQQFLPRRGKEASAVYRPLLLAAAQAHFLDAKAKVDLTREMVFLAPLGDGAVAVNWDEAVPVEIDLSELTAEPPSDGAYAEVPAPAAKAKSYAAWGREFAAWLQRTQTLDLLRSPATGLLSGPDEAERDFRIRVQQAVREARDQAVEELGRKYAPKRAVLEERRRRAQQAAEREAEQARQAKMNSAISFGATLLGAFLGRKTVSTGTLGRATTAARSAGRVRKESQDVARAGETVAAVEQQLADLDVQFQAEAAGRQSRFDESFETIQVRLKRTGIAPRLVTLAWADEGYTSVA